MDKVNTMPSIWLWVAIAVGVVILLGLIIALVYGLKARGRSTSRAGDYAEPVTAETVAKPIVVEATTKAEDTAKTVQIYNYVDSQERAQPKVEQTPAPVVYERPARDPNYDSLRDLIVETQQDVHSLKRQMADTPVERMPDRVIDYQARGNQQEINDLRRQMSEMMMEKLVDKLENKLAENQQNLSAVQRQMEEMRAEKATDRLEMQLQASKQEIEALHRQMNEMNSRPAPVAERYEPAMRDSATQYDLAMIKRQLDELTAQRNSDRYDYQMRDTQYDLMSIKRQLDELLSQRNSNNRYNPQLMDTQYDLMALKRQVEDLYAGRSNDHLQSQLRDTQQDLGDIKRQLNDLYAGRSTDNNFQSQLRDTQYDVGALKRQVDELRQQREQPVRREPRALPGSRDVSAIQRQTNEIYGTRVAEDYDDYDASLLDDDDDDDGMFLPDDDVVFSAPQLTLREAYSQLSFQQKRYFDRLHRYASEKPDARVKEAKTYLTIGVGNKSYVQLAIKRNVVVAYFLLESEEMLRLRLLDETYVKPEKTKIKIVNEEAFESALKMIDVREVQVAREITLVKELRREKQRLRYESLKKR